MTQGSRFGETLEAMKKPIHLLSVLFLLLFTLGLSAEETTKATTGEKAKPTATDPFVKKKREKAASPKPKTESTIHSNVGVVVQYIDVTRERWHQWLAENDISIDASDLRGEVGKWLASGDAILAESSLVMGQSGQRAKVESVRSLVYPNQFAEDGHGGHAFPTATEQRQVGTTTEVDTVLESEDRVSINFAPERVRYAGENPPHAETGVLEGDLRHPVFETQKVTTSVKLDPRSWGLVGCERSFERGETHQTLVFTRPLVHHFEEPAAKTEHGSQGIVTFTWLETSHEQLNESLVKVTDASPWVGAGLHDELRKSDAQVVEERSVYFQSGQRSKNESIREMTVPTKWKMPENVFFAVPEAAEKWKVGTTVEVDAVLSAGGGSLELNMAPETVSLVGSDVFHRVLVDGEWKANVTMASLYSMKPTTKLHLPLGVPVLVAVMTPPNDEGWADASRKRVLFVTFSR